MQVQTESNRLGDILKYETGEVKRLSREDVTVLSGQELSIGAVLGKITKSTPTTGTAGTNTGGGTMTSVTAGTKAEIGTYTVKCVDIGTSAPATPATATKYASSSGNGVMSAVVVGATAKVGTYLLDVVSTGATAGFIVRYPDGSYVGQGAVGTEFVGGGLTFTLADGATDYQIGDGYTIVVAAATSGAGALWDVIKPNGEVLQSQALTGTAYTSSHLNFTINDSGTNFAAGDTFTVAVAAGSGKVRALNLSGVDGSQDAYGILIDAVDTTGTLKSVAYTSGGTYEVVPGDQITGATGAATARVVSLSLSSGTWAGADAAGTLVLDDVVGTFQAENLDVGDNSNVATIGGDAAAYYPDRAGVAVVKDAVIDSDNLVWPAGATTDQKTAALAQLADKGIIARTAA